MDVRVWLLVRNTALLCAAACAISVPLGTLLGWLLTRTDVPGRRVFLFLLATMLFVPLYMHAAAWEAGFGLQGWCTLLCGAPVWLDRWPAAIWVHAMAGVPWVVLITGVGFCCVERELEEQALLDGSPVHVFFRVTLPAVLPAVAVAALWVAVSTAGEMTATDLFRVRTYAEEVYTQLAVSQEPDSLPLGVRSGVLVTTLLVAAGLACCAFVAPHGRPLTLASPRVFQTGLFRLPLAILVLGLMLLLIGLPLGSLCYKAGVLVSQGDAGLIRTFSPGKCLATIAAAPWRCRRELGSSLSIGALAAAAAVLAAIPLAWAARGGERPGSRPRTILSLAIRVAVVAVAAVCLAVPGPVLGLSVIWLLNRPECPWLLFLYDRSILAPCLAMWVRGLPPAVLILWHAFRSVPQAMIEGAAVDGAGPFGTFWHVVLPLRWRAVLAALLVAWVVAVGELSASILVVPPGTTLLSIHIFGLLHYGVEDQVAGICLAMVGLFAALTGAATALGYNTVGGGRWAVGGGQK